MELDEFHNGLRILLNIDPHQLVLENIMKDTDVEAWERFQTDPFRWFIRANDNQAEALFKIIQNGNQHLQFTTEETEHNSVCRKCEGTGWANGGH